MIDCLQGKNNNSLQIGITRFGKWLLEAIKTKKNSYNLLGMCRSRLKTTSDAMQLLPDTKFRKNIIQLIFVRDLSCDLTEIMKATAYIKRQ
jgi:hypothetical protein